MHWARMSIPGVATTWYARWIYEQGSEGNKYHVATYGHPSKFGYKDICKLFHGAQVRPGPGGPVGRALQKIGARLRGAGRGAPRHFDSGIPNTSPGGIPSSPPARIFVGMWRKAVDKEGLRLGVASHFARTYRWLQPSHGAGPFRSDAGVAYDGQDPQYADLYGVKWKDQGFFPISGMSSAWTSAHRLREELRDA